MAGEAYPFRRHPVTNLPEVQDLMLILGYVWS
jgi:hypothetical protein